MPAQSPLLDEHGFPIPPTFEAPRPSGPHAPRFRRLWRLGLIAAFAATLLAVAFRSTLLDSAKGLIAEKLVQRAQEKVAYDDLPGALADLDRAVSWTPERPIAYQLRAEVRLAMHDVSGSLEDFNTLIRLAPRFAPAYVGRGGALMRLGRLREAIDDQTRAIGLGPERWTMPLNNRAYFRALAGIELNEALIDIEEALRLLDERINDFRLQIADASKLRDFNVRAGGERATFLDTRGYVLLGQGKLSDANRDFDEAIKATRDYEELLLKDTGTKASEREAIQQKFKGDLAVMYHHRGEVREKMGHPDARADLDLSLELGYNPDRGVY